MGAHGGVLGVGMHDFRLNRWPENCVYTGGATEKHTCALTSGTFMCCNAVLMNKTSGPVCEKTACHLARHPQQLRIQTQVRTHATLLHKHRDIHKPDVGEGNK